MARSLTLVLSVTALALNICAVVWICAVTVKPWLTPEQILERFYSNIAPEDTLMDPLILGGEKVVPLIINEVQRRDMPRRRYAIGFLGNGAYFSSVPILERIVEDETEKDYIRGDALKAIYQTEPSLGVKKAKLYTTYRDNLGEMARHITKATPVATNRRSYLQALLKK